MGHDLRRGRRSRQIHTDTAWDAVEAVDVVDVVDVGNTCSERTAPTTYAADSDSTF